MSARPFLRFYPADYLADTRGLSRSEHGGYFLLILEYWQRGGPLPDDDALLRSITLSTRYAWKKLREKLQNFFTLEGGFWHHKRIDRDLAKLKHRNDLEARNTAPASAAHISARGSQNPDTRISESPAKPGAPATAPTAPPRAPPAAGNSIFDRGKELLGAARTGLVGAMLKLHGFDRVKHALDEVDRRQPRSPPAFFRAICENRQAQPPPAPAERKYTAEEHEAARREIYRRNGWVFPGDAAQAAAA